MLGALGGKKKCLEPWPTYVTVHVPGSAFVGSLTTFPVSVCACPGAVEKCQTTVTTELTTASTMAASTRACTFGWGASSLHAGAVVGAGFSTKLVAFFFPPRSCILHAFAVAACTVKSCPRNVSDGRGGASSISAGALSASRRCSCSVAAGCRGGVQCGRVASGEACGGEPADVAEERAFDTPNSCTQDCVGEKVSASTGEKERTGSGGASSQRSPLTAATHERRGGGVRLSVGVFIPGLGSTPSRRRRSYAAKSRASDKDTRIVSVAKHRR